MTTQKAAAKILMKALAAEQEAERILYDAQEKHKKAAEEAKAAVAEYASHESLALARKVKRSPMFYLFNKEEIACRAQELIRDGS